MEALKVLLEIAQAKINAYFTQFDYIFPALLSVTDGPSYWRIAKNERHIKGHPEEGQPNGQRSVYCFVRKSDGAILKAASWKKPDTKRVRGYLSDSPEKISAILTNHGVVYLR